MSVVNIDQGHPAVLPHVRIQPAKGLLELDLAAFWQYRELIHILVWRDVTVRYKTERCLGVAWAMFQPVATMLIFTVVFSVMGKIPSDGFPYPVFSTPVCCHGLYFSGVGPGRNQFGGRARSSAKCISPAHPSLSATIAPLVDLFLAFIAFPRPHGLVFILMPTWRFCSTAVRRAGRDDHLCRGLWVSALPSDTGMSAIFFPCSFSWDVRVTYPVPCSKVPGIVARHLCLNPVVSVGGDFDGHCPGLSRSTFRWFFPVWALFLSSFIGGLIYFRSMERTLRHDLNEYRCNPGRRAVGTIDWGSRPAQYAA